MSNDPQELDQFNSHQEDTRKRTDSLAKSVFLLSGGALTLSIGVFLRKESQEIPMELVTWLKRAWFSLFMSITLFVLVLSVMIIRDYYFGELWRKELNGKANSSENSPGCFDVIMWVLGLLAILCFLFGFGALAWVACSLLTKVT